MTGKPTLNNKENQMRLIKMFSLAMVVAAAAMAVIGAGTASATLCKVNENFCSFANEYPVPTTILMSSPKIALVASFTTEFASHATLVHEGESEAKLIGKFTLLDWKNCSFCAEFTTTSLGKFKDDETFEGNGSFFPEGQVVLMKGCPFGAECTFRSITGKTVLNFDGGTIKGTALGLANTTVKVEGGSLCSASGTGTLRAETPYSVVSVNGSETGSIFLE
jgi:hypothetical protein